MDYEADLKACCIQMIMILRKLQEQGKITEEEYQLYTKEMNKYLQWIDSKCNML